MTQRTVIGVTQDGTGERRGVSPPCFCRRAGASPTAGLRRAARPTPCWLALVAALLPLTASAAPLPGTQPLTQEGDLAAAMVAGIGKYLDRELASSSQRRPQFWKPDLSSAEAYARSVQPNRDRLRKLLGVVDTRLPPRLEYVGGPDEPALVAETDAYAVSAVRWAVLPGVDGEGLLLEPKGRKPAANVIALPDADWTPEMLSGLAPGLAKESQFARRLAENGCRVLVPVLIDRGDDFSGNPKLGRATNQPHREFVYRMAYEMGRHVIGYEVQKVLAAADWFAREPGHAPIAVAGVSEGGVIAYFAGCLDERIAAVQTNGSSLPTSDIWQRPIYRNLWGVLPEFDARNLSHGNALLQPRVYGLEASAVPAVDGPRPPRPGRAGAAPGSIPGTPGEFLRGQVRRPPWATGTWFSSNCPPGDSAVSLVLDKLLHVPEKAVVPDAAPARERRTAFDPAVRQRRQFDQLVAHVQKLWRNSDATRKAFWAKADSSSPEKWEASCEAYRTYFYEDVIGKLPPPTLPPNPRTRQIYDQPKWTGHEVVLDLYPGVFAFGVLLLPKDVKPGERRPVVVCQHGLEGRPTDTTDPTRKTPYYNSFAAQLADLGYIVYAPQNPYIGKDDFRVLQRKANPLKLSLFSFIVRQHERTLGWLATLPNVDKDRIALYGLSYGGKTAMRVPAILKGYCLSICSGDFNEWVGKNVSVDLPGSYMFTGEYEMFEFDLGSTFNYAEMAYLIAPRPFMVERGHDDGVGIDEWVASEYAKVRYLYANKLKLPERTEIEFFPGGHVINGRGTFAFLRRHLGWPH
jgi:dienelactone hydrolase